MITAVTSEARGGRFAVTVQFDDGDEAIELFSGMSKRMADQTGAGGGAVERALSVADLEGLANLHGATAAVHDRGGNLWRWSLDRDTWYRPNARPETNAGTHWSSWDLIKEFGPIREA